MNKLKVLLLILIISIPSFISLLNNNFFPMHDDQHIARLFLLDQGLRQGSIYPRWVDILGFNLGYPLFNFYPPLIYYVGETFHILGFSLIWSVKLTFIAGFFFGALGMFLLSKKITDTWAAFLSTVLYTYFSYHAVLIYVRGALAEFFAMAVLPYVFLAIITLAKKTSLKNSIFLGISLAILILTHPLIAVPSLFYIGALFIFYIIIVKDKLKFFTHFLLGGIAGLSLSAFFWLPSMIERKFTLVDNILTKELASFKIHYIFPSQFIYSPWGFGASLQGPVDGMSFQLGKIHGGLVIISVILSFAYFTSLRAKRSNLDKGIATSSPIPRNDGLKYFFFFLILFLFSLFMTTEYSGFVWNNVKYLWYLQFPWRFLTFTGIFMSIVGGYVIYFLKESISQNKLFVIGVTLLVSIGVIGTYQKYFKPSRYILTTDKQLTSFEEIAWRVSRTSFEFIPKEVKTTKSDLNTTIPVIDKNHIVTSSYEITEGYADIKQVENKFEKKSFTITASTPVKFRLNTYNFPGWKAYIDGQSTSVNESDDYKRINIKIPAGNHALLFKFENTLVRTIANALSWLSAGVFVIILIQNVTMLRKAIGSICNLYYLKKSK